MFVFSYSFEKNIEKARQHLWYQQVKDKETYLVFNWFLKILSKKKKLTAVVFFSFFIKFLDVIFIILSFIIYIFAGYHCTKMKFCIKDFFSKCDQIHSFLQIWSRLLKKPLMENFIFCAVYVTTFFFLLNIFNGNWFFFRLLDWYSSFKYRHYAKFSKNLFLVSIELKKENAKFVVR